MVAMPSSSIATGDSLCQQRQQRRPQQQQQQQLEQFLEQLRHNGHWATTDRLSLRDSTFLNDEALHEILALLHNHAAVCRIHTLTLAANKLLSTISITRLADTIRNRTTLCLRELDLSYNPQAFTNESLSALASALSSGNSSSRSSSASSSSAAAVVTALERLNLSGNGLHQKDLCPCLERLVRHNRSVTHLYLSDNHFGSRHMQLLAPGLASNRTVRHLVLSNNPLKDAGVKRFLSSSITDRLMTLDLSMTQCGRTGASHLQSCLLHNRSIQNLQLAHNNQIGHDGAAYFQAILCHNYTLRELNLSHNNIRNDGMTAIVRGMLDSSDYYHQDNVTRLTHLDVSYNGLTDTTIIAQLIEKSILIHLNLRGNAMADLSPVAAAVHADVSLKHLDISHNHMTDPSCWIELMYHGSYTLDVFHYDDNHLDDIQTERMEAAVCFLQNEKTWLAKLLRQIETRPRVSLDLTGYRYGDEEMIRIVQALDRYRPVVEKASLTNLHDRAFLALFGRRRRRRETTPVEPSSALLRNNSSHHHHHRHHHNGTTRTTTAITTTTTPASHRLNIVRLHLSDCQFVGHEGWSDLARAIGSGSSSGSHFNGGGDNGNNNEDDNNDDACCPLETLSLLRCRLPQPLVLATALRHSTNLKRLCLESSLGSASVDAKAILAAALAHPNLVYLDLANNGLTDDVLVGMPPIERLRMLLLHNNDLTDKGALSLAQAVMDCKTITWLTVKGNRLTRKGIVSLTLFLKLNEVLDCHEDCND